MFTFQHRNIMQIIYSLCKAMFCLPFLLTNFDLHWIMTELNLDVGARQKVLAFVLIWNLTYLKLVITREVIGFWSTFASGAAPRRQASPQEVHLCFRLSASIFGSWGLVRLLWLQFLHGYAYVRVSNNKQQITLREFKPNKPWSKRYKKNQERFFGKLGGWILLLFCIFHIFTISCSQKGSVTLRMHQIPFSLGLCPRPCWGSSWRSFRVSSRLGRGILSPHSPPNACGALPWVLGLLQGLRR